MLDRWLHQRYFGQEANIGEDRAITNLILEQGFKVRFQSTACVLTKVPVHFAGLRKMYTRWARSDVRESIAFARFGFGRFADWPRWRMMLTRLNFIAKSASISLAWPMLTVMIALSLAFPMAIGLKLVAGTIAGSAWMLAICAWRGRRFDAIFAVPYALFWLAALWWITPWGLATSHRGGWLTRADTRPSLLRRLAAAMGAAFARAGRLVIQRTPGLARLTSLLF
ncbi:MAG: hypothetical protein PHU85_15855 [Phycisphaerae bacterium]|nr:hypothetical protein [Phycisphaerae bacterium]